MDNCETPVAVKEWLGYPESDNASQIPSKPVEEVCVRLRDTSSASIPFLLIDVRRTDADVSDSFLIIIELTIHDVLLYALQDYLLKGSINLPAQTFYPNSIAIANMLTTLAKAQRSGTLDVIVYCGSCSATGRGRRCAAWLRDALDTNKSLSVFVMEGGAKAFISKYKNESYAREVLDEVPAAARVA